MPALPPAKIKRLPLTGAKLAAPLDISQPGMPAADSIHAVVKFKAKYRILKSTEVDSYEQTPTAVAVKKTLTGKQPSPPAGAQGMKRAAGGGEQLSRPARERGKII